MIWQICYKSHKVMYVCIYMYVYICMYVYMFPLGQTHIYSCEGSEAETICHEQKCEVSTKER